MQYLQQLILQPEDEGKSVNKKFKEADSFFITETKAIADPRQRPDPFFRIFSRSCMIFQRKWLR